MDDDASRLVRHEVVRRRWKYAPPPWVMYEAVTEQRSRWLVLEPGEVHPVTSSARRPELVVLEPWLDPAIAALEVRIEADGAGSALTLIGYTTCEALDVGARRRVRHRLGSCFGAALREWVDEPHW